MAEFTMPSLGADMEEGLLQEWLVHPGDHVGRGDAVAVVETAKSAIEVECFETGTVGALLVEPGTTVPVGTVLATIETEPEAAEARANPRRTRRAAPPADEGRTEREHSAARAPDLPPAEAPELPVAPDRLEAGPLLRRDAERAGVDLASVHGSGPGGRVTRHDVERAGEDSAAARPPARRQVTPLARRLAGELDVDLAEIGGTGKNGAIRAGDVRRAAAGPRTETVPRPSAPTPTREERPTPMRRAIADLMTRANREIPHYHLATTIDLHPAMEWLHEHNRNSPVDRRLLPAALLIKATARAAAEVPAFNGFWIDDHFEAGSGVHVGVAVSLRGGGLVAPALHDADTLEVTALMAALKDVVVRARSGRLRGSEVSGATITVTNLGDQGAEAVFGVIHPPQVALVGFGRVVDRPWAVDGLLGVRPVVTATLSADHRATDGSVGARFLSVVDRQLQSPEHL